MPTGPYLCLRKIIKIIQTIKKSLSVQEFGLKNLFSGVYEKKNEARFVLLACDTST